MAQYYREQPLQDERIESGSVAGHDGRDPLNDASTERLILFAKRPRLGGVKTRLVPPLSSEQALKLYRALLADSIRGCRAAASRGREFELCMDAPWRSGTEVSGGPAPSSTTLQGPGDLGQRMLRAFRRSRREGSTATVVVGADSPTLPRGRIDAAFERLVAGIPAVICGSTDGGYVLVGLREPLDDLFREIPWGGPDVARVTRERAADAGIELAELEPWYDVDDAAGLDRLRRELVDPACAERTPATAAWIARTPI